MSKRAKKTPQSVNEHVCNLERHLEGQGLQNRPNEPTAERVRQAADHRGRTNNLRAKVHYTDSGIPTAAFNWRISPILDELEKRGTLDQHDWQVAMRYMRDYVGSRHKGPATSQFVPFSDYSPCSLTPPERILSSGQAVQAARQAVPCMLHPVLDWLEASCGDEEPLWRLGSIYYPNLSPSQQSAKAPAMLHCTLGILAVHYGMDHRWMNAR